MNLLSREPPERSGWTATRWSMVSSLDRREEPAWQASWLYLVQAYRPPMEGYVQRLLGRLRNRPCAAEEATEVVQAFLVSCVEKGWLSKATPTKGRFRAYLQTLLRRYAFRHVERERAQRRSPGPGYRVLSLVDPDALEEPLSSEDQTELQGFDRSWVQVALDRARRRLGDQNQRYLMVIDDLIRTEGEGSVDLAERVGLAAAQVPVLRHRARQRFAKLFQEELAATVADEDAFREEWRALQAYLP